MKIVKNGYKFWNYAKEKEIEIHLDSCPICKGEAILQGFDNEAHTNFVASCPNCHITTDIYFTDSNHCRNMGIEMAANAWNNKEIFDESGEEIEI